MAIGSDIHEPFSFTAALADGDEFLIGGLLTASDSGTRILADVATGSGIFVEYLGGPGGVSQPDTLNIDRTFAFNVSFTSGTYFSGPIFGGFSTNISPGSWTTSDGTNNGKTESHFGPYTAPGLFNASAVNYQATDTGVVTLGIADVFSFAAGSPAGSYIYYGPPPTSTIPEPGTAWLMAIPLALTFAPARWRTRKPFASLS